MGKKEWGLYANPGGVFSRILRTWHGTFEVEPNFNAEGYFEVRVLLQAECSYNPGTHAYPVDVHIEKGTGVFLCAGERRAYEPGSVFYIKANDMHGFLEVQTETIFRKTAKRALQ